MMLLHKSVGGWLTRLLFLLGAMMVGAQDDILGRPLYYTLDDTASSSFQCIFNGARCSFMEGNFASVRSSPGAQTTATIEGTVWSPLNASIQTLTLGPCTADFCVVTCTANCSCTSMGDAADQLSQPCQQSYTAAPSTPEPTRAPVQQICPRRSDAALRDEHCPRLMASVSENRRHDCYNFCGGNFVTACEFGAPACAAPTCTDVTTDGRWTDVIEGCTDDDRAPVPAPVASPEVETTTTTTSTSRAARVAASVLAVFGVVVIGVVWW